MSGQPAPTSNYLYTGQQFDKLTGLYDLRARYYNPTDGRFLSQDKASLGLYNPIELSRYIYAANNPITNNDPSGYNMVMTGSGSGTFEYGLLLGAASAAGYAGAKVLGFNVEDLIVRLSLNVTSATLQLVANAVKSLLNIRRITIAFAYPKVQGAYKVAVIAFISTRGALSVPLELGSKAKEAIMGLSSGSQYFDFAIAGAEAKDLHAEQLMRRLITRLNGTAPIDSNQKLILGRVINDFCDTYCVPSADEVGPADSTGKVSWLKWKINGDKALKLYNVRVPFALE